MCVIIVCTVDCLHTHIQASSRFRCGLACLDFPADQRQVAQIGAEMFPSIEL